MTGLVLVYSLISIFYAENIVLFHASVKMTAQVAAPVLIDQ